MIPLQAMGFWPGLPGLWFRGEPKGLVWAILYAVSLNVALLATFHWPEWFSPWVVRSLWILNVCVSLGSGLVNWMKWKEMVGIAPVDAGADAYFFEAQEFYLRGEFFEAEASLHRIFSSGKQDVEAAILMVSILRRTRRWAQALFCIDRLLLLDKSAPWRRELALERKQIQEAMGKLEVDPSESKGKQDLIAA